MDSDKLLDAAKAWWRTEIIDIAPGQIDIRGYPVQQLIGQVDFVSMIWLMLRGELPTPVQSRLLEATLVASVDHGPQAPSISIARMASTCGVGINNAMASGINSLGDVHGGAGQQCLEVYDAVITAAAGDLNGPAAREAVALEITRRKHLPGFGHRFHPVDPRSEPLLQLVEQAVAGGDVPGRHLAAARTVASVLTQVKGKPIPMNIDGATAVIYGELGFNATLARGLFILSRSVGILAHAAEQMAQGGRIKGPMPTSIPYTYAGKARRHLEGQA
jgi:citrate synthase